MNNMKEVLIFVMEILIKTVSVFLAFVGKIDDIITKVFVKCVIGVPEWFFVKLKQVCDKVSFLRIVRVLLVYVIIALALASYWPFTALIGILCFAKDVMSEDEVEVSEVVKGFIYQITRKMLYIFLLWSFIRPLYVFPDNMTIYGIAFIGFNPIRVSCTCLLYKLYYEHKSFIYKTPEEFDIEVQEEEEKLEVCGKDDD